ncbi:MAG: hypothetical protein KGH98_00020 [Candidatus Micrarchaeota archaeon]|nr:hypothetical protein [Candidatus Micrarchaeota archaeon]
MKLFKRETKAIKNEAVHYSIDAAMARLNTSLLLEAKSRLDLTAKSRPFTQSEEFAIGIRAAVNEVDRYASYISSGADDPKNIERLDLLGGLAFSELHGIADRSAGLGAQQIQQTAMRLMFCVSLSVADQTTKAALDHDIFYSGYIREAAAWYSMAWEVYADYRSDKANYERIKGARAYAKEQQGAGLEGVMRSAGQIIRTHDQIGPMLRGLKGERLRLVETGIGLGLLEKQGSRAQAIELRIPRNRGYRGD